MACHELLQDVFHPSLVDTSKSLRLRNGRLRKTRSEIAVKHCHRVIGSGTSVLLGLSSNSLRCQEETCHDRAIRPRWLKELLRLGRDLCTEDWCRSAGGSERVQHS